MVGAFQIIEKSFSSPSSEQIELTKFFKSRFMFARISSLGCLVSTVKKTCPGIELIEAGFVSRRPTVPTAPGCFSTISRSPIMIREAPMMGSLRKCIGVVPAWEPCPCRVMCVQ